MSNIIIFIWKKLPSSSYILNYLVCVNCHIKQIKFGINVALNEMLIKSLKIITNKWQNGQVRAKVIGA